MNYFKDKRAIITGAASGIGRLMSIEMARSGATVYLVDINQEALESLSRELTAQKYENYYFKVDLSSLEDMQKLANDISQKTGVIDILINNAGVVFGGEFEGQDLSKHLLTYQININAVVSLTHLFFSHLKMSSGANIVNISSASGLLGLPYGSTYASSKWAVLGFSESLRLELKERSINNISVTTVCPSYISTGMFNGVKAPILVPWLKPEVIVEKILIGISQKKAYIKEPFVVKWIDFLKGVLPLDLFVFINKLIGVSTSMAHWKGRK